MSLYKIIQGDCFKVLPTLKTNSIDLLLTDPPYNIAGTSRIGFDKGVPKATKDIWGASFKDDYTEAEYSKFMLDLAKLSFRLLKQDGSLLLFFDKGKPYYLTPFYRLLKSRNIICFVKTNPPPHIRLNNYRSSFELCAWFSKERYNVNFISQKEMKNVFSGRTSGTKHTDHPTEKSEWMIKPLIERHSKRGDLILDPFLGSGTTMKVCQDLGRSCIGIEIEPEYCEMSKNRIFGKTFLDRNVEYEFSQFMEAEE